MRVIATRKIHNLGRIVLPWEVRKKHQIEESATLDVCVNDDNQIVLRKI